MIKNIFGPCLNLSLHDHIFEHLAIWIQNNFVSNDETHYCIFRVDGTQKGSCMVKLTPLPTIELYRRYLRGNIVPEWRILLWFDN